MMENVTDNSILKLNNISKVFCRGTRDEVKALDGVDLEVSEQDFVTVIGSNGAGKSTLLNIVAGVFPPEKGGRITMCGNDVSNLEEHKRATYVGRVWQEPEVGTAGKLSIEENLSLALLRARPRRLKAALNKERRDTFREALSVLGLGLEDRLNTPVGTLSGGQRQALALVMATISRPAILLLDEHIATLDPRTAQTVLEISDALINREKMTTLMITHNMDIALRYGTRLIMMHKGRIIVDLSAEERKALAVNDLVTAFERAAGEQFTDDSVLLH